MERILAAKPYIIAEVGSNWECQNDLLGSVIAAKEAGADAVKFQLFSAYDLYGPDAGITSGVAAAEYSKSYLEPYLPYLALHCGCVGIDFMCSAFSIEGYRRVDPFVKYHKIASSEFNHVPLVREVVKMGKPILASTGGQDGSTIQDIHRECFSVPLILMQCQASYPSWNFTAHEGLVGPVALSDHTLGIYYPVMVQQSIGLKVLEKHFKLDHITDTPDAPHSITPAQFKQMVDLIRAPVPEDEEAEFKRTALRRAKALVPINPGDALQYGVNYAYFRDREGRPGLSPIDHDKNEGRVVNTPLAAGECIEVGDVR